MTSWPTAHQARAYGLRVTTVPGWPHSVLAGRSRRMGSDRLLGALHEAEHAVSADLGAGGGPVRGPVRSEGGELVLARHVELSFGVGDFLSSFVEEASS